MVEKLGVVYNSYCYKHPLYISAHEYNSKLKNTKHHDVADAQSEHKIAYTTDISCHRKHIKYDCILYARNGLLKLSL